jgi:hypothetical protein
VTMQAYQQVLIREEFASNSILQWLAAMRSVALQLCGLIALTGSAVPAQRNKSPQLLTMGENGALGFARNGTVAHYGVDEFFEGSKRHSYIVKLHKGTAFDDAVRLAELARVAGYAGPMCDLSYLQNRSPLVASVLSDVNRGRSRSSSTAEIELVLRKAVESAADGSVDDAKNDTFMDTAQVAGTAVSGNADAENDASKCVRVNCVF